MSPDAGQPQQIDLENEADEEFEDGQAALLDLASRPRAGLNPSRLGRQIAEGASNPDEEDDER